MSEIALRVSHLSKQYTLDQRAGGDQSVVHDSLRELLAASMAAPLRWMGTHFGRKMTETAATTATTQPFFALQDLSFEVKRGEVVGIIGRNGAGKSTLLKILTRIMEPTSGEVEVHGRVGALLEVGAGFHGELSGRENIYLSGAILGMRRAEINRKFAEIVAFAEIEKFLDTPVKRYSSGMYMRLAFAVAAHLEPEILLVDEVLAVGDAEFQKKCLDKMQAVASEGRTVLFVSHNLTAMRVLCQRAIVLNAGKLTYSGPVAESIAQYLKTNQGRSGSILTHLDYCDPLVQLTQVKVNGSTSDECHLPAETRTITIEMRGRLAQPLCIDVVVRIIDLHGVPLAFFSPGHERGYAASQPSGDFCFERTFSLPRIMRGSYYLTLGLTEPEVKLWVSLRSAVRLIVEGEPTANGSVLTYERNAGWVFLEQA